MERITCRPDAGRTIMGFRDTGYTLYTAVADIIDNSINAKADNVWVTLEKDPAGQVFVRIIDDGYGMNRDELIAAMRYGSPERKDGNTLGRFGLGLKTASTSACRKLTVISRKSVKADPLAACWDLDLVKDKEDWILQVGEPEADHGEIFAQHVPASGTIVCWDKVDRLGSHEDVDTGGISNQALGSYTRRLREHLELVFHRFMEEGKLKIFLNGEVIEPWNPFVPGETTKHAISRTFKIQVPHSKATYKVTLNAYIIPNKYEYSTEAARTRAKISNRLQGFYVYRENRVIIFADWLSMYSQEPHISLLRTELSFPRELDELLSLDIKKSTLNLHPALYAAIQKEIDPVRREADRRYRQGQKVGVKRKGSPHEQSQALIGSKYDDTTSDVKANKVGPNTVEITNANGKTVITMPTVETGNISDLIEVADTINDGLFWEPVLINNRIGVRINRGHIYYDRVYVPNFDDSVTVRGIDSILWALAKCEEEVMNSDIRKKLTDLRYQVSRTLRELAEELPEPPENDNGTGA